MKVLHLLFSTGLIAGLSYLFGHTMLGGSLKGDSAMHVGYAVWLNAYFPEVPHWYPLQGGGTSLLHGYPILPHILVILLHRLSGLSLPQAFRFIGFAGFPLTALGIYFLCWSVLKRQTVGLIAAVFFLLAPVTWTWMYDWGFFSQQVAIIFAPLALLAFDRTLKAHLSRRRTGSRRIWFVALAVSMVIMSLCHMMVSAAVAAGIFLYTVFASLIAPRGHRATILREGLKVLTLAGLTTALVLAAYIVPFYAYGQLANREGLNDLPAHAFHQLPVQEFFGLKKIDLREILSRMQFPLPVTLFAILGGLLAFKNRAREGEDPGKVATWALVALAATTFTLSPALVILVQKASPLLVNFLNFRSLLILLMILIPMVAAYGAWSLASELAEIARTWWGRARRVVRPDPLVDSGTGLLVPVAALLIAWVGVIPGPGAIAPEPWLPDYGPKRMDLRDIWDRRADDPCILTAVFANATTLCQIPEARRSLNIGEFGAICAETQSQGAEIPPLCRNEAPTALQVREFISGCQSENSLQKGWAPCDALVGSGLEQLLPVSWPPFQLDGEDGQTEQHRLLATLLPDDPMLRIDVSPNLGRLAQDLTVYTHTSQIPAYTNQLSLIHLTWGYQLGAFYFDSYGSTTQVDELAKWLGINYVILDPRRDSAANFSASSWESTYETEEFRLLHFRQSLPLASAITRPVILVVGAAERGVYHDLFRLANNGLASYDQMVLVEGDSRIDSYTLDELRSFDALLLHGYDYKNSEQAWDLLRQYVETGGSLFVDTGWQYSVPEWEFEQAPDVLPVAQLSWTNYGSEGTYTLDSEEFAAGININGFDPLIWEQDPWSVSGATVDSVREWAEPVLSIGGNPLIVAGEIGQGRVAWSGMNFISHLLAYDNIEERGLLQNLLQWLVRGKQGVELVAPVVRRDNPDQVTFLVDTAPGNVTWLYWREAYYPNWTMELADGESVYELPIYRAGPGFMLVPIESNSETVTLSLRWRPSLAENAAYAVSMLGVLFLAGLVLDGLLLSGNGFTWLRIALSMRIPKPFLGEGSNREWAERKRAELDGGQERAERKVYQPSEAIPWFGGKQRIEAGEDGTEDRERALGGRQFIIEAPILEDQEGLLESWLEETGHSEDAWANRLLRKRDPSEQA